MIANITGQLSEKFLHFAPFPAGLGLASVDLHSLRKKIVDVDDATVSSLWLNSTEQERFNAFRYEKRKVEWLGGRIAAKCAARQVLNNCSDLTGEQNWQDLFIATTDHGKPFLQHQLAGNKVKLPKISISHTSGLAVAMACSENCGVDIQQITPALERVQERFCSADEHDKLSVVVDRSGSQQALALLWSAKEAVKKAVTVQPLPGFMEITLREVKKADNVYLFAMALSAHSKGVKGQANVFSCLLDDLSFAMTVFNEETGG